MAPVLDTLNRPLHDLRISVIDQCNLRCRYCMPAEIFGPDYAFLNKNELLSFDEIERLARLFVSLGVSKLRLTGGEPLLRKGLSGLITRLHQIPGIDDVALTTNGVLLSRFAPDLKAAGLQRITVSLDALDEDCFQKMNGGRTQAVKVLEGIQAAQDVGFQVKVNAVIEKGVNESQILPLAKYARKNNLILRFIEFMDVGNHNRWEMAKVFPSKEIVSLLDQAFGIEPIDPNYRGEVARRYRYKDGSTEFGIIASVTAPFCADCSRTRLSADGQLYTCLFGNIGWDLRGLMREGIGDQELIERLSRIWARRTDRYSEERSTYLTEHKYLHKVEMSYNGG